MQERRNDTAPDAGSVPGDEPAEAIVAMDIDADLDAVWTALTTDEGLAEWIGAGSTIGAAPGDELRFRDTVSGEDKRGFLDEFTPLRRLGYTWWPETDPARSTRVAISLEPSRTGTRVTVVESRPASAPAATSFTARAASTGTALVGTAGPAAVARADWLFRLATLALSLTAVSVSASILSVASRA